MNTKSHKIKVLGFLFLINYTFAFLNSFTNSFMGGIAWYSQFTAPGLSPPGWVYGVVWVLLFSLMALSGWITWKNCKDSRQIRQIGFIYFGQLLVNYLWVVLFFLLHQPVLAFVNLLIMFLMIIFYMIISWPVSKAGSLLFAPYAIWTVFAAHLNYDFILLNGF